MLAAAVAAAYVSQFVLVSEIPGSAFPDGIPFVEESITIGGDANDKLLIRYDRHCDSGVEVERVTRKRSRWVIYSIPHGVEHSKYNHKVTATVTGNIIQLRSQGSYSTVHEQRELKSGDLIRRSIK